MGKHEPKGVVATVRSSCQAFGLAPPPAVLRLRLLTQPAGYTMLVWGPPGCTPDVVRWMEGFGPLCLRFPQPGENRVLWFELAAEPASWARWKGPATVEDVLFEPGGTATVTLRGPRRAVQALAARLDAVVSGPGRRPLRLAGAAAPPGAKRALTKRQREALTLALASGYYEVPRRVSLRALAARLAVSPAALTELLRRAETRALTDDAGPLADHGAPAARPAGPAMDQRRGTGAGGHGRSTRRARRRGRGRARALPECEGPSKMSRMPPANRGSGSTYARKEA